MTMIQDYELTKNIIISKGRANIHFAVEAKDVPIEDAKSAGDSFDLFLKDLQSEMPEGERTRRRAFKMYNDKEMQVIQDAPDFRAAWEAYHAMFPQSPRTYDAIRKQWNKQHAVAEEPSSAPTSETRHKPAANDGPIAPPQSCDNARKAAKKPKAKAATVRKGINKWQIPFSATTQKKEYQRAWLLCRIYNLPYPEALKKEQEKNADAGKAPENKTKPVPKAKASEPVGGARPKEITVKDLKITEEPIEPKTAGPDKVDTSSVPCSDNVTTPDKEQGEDPDPKPAGLARGMKVRYIGSHPHVAFQGLKEVKRVNVRSGEALIDIGKGIEWIPTRDLVVAA